MGESAELRTEPVLDAPRDAKWKPSVEEASTACSLDWAHPERMSSGFINQGNTCFLNSVLQLLCATPPLAALAQRGTHQSTCFVPDCALCVLERRISASLRSTTALAPTDVLSCMRRLPGLRRLTSGRQEDAHEALRLTLEALQHSSLRGQGCPTYGPGAAPGPHRERTVVECVFGGELMSRVTCHACRAESDTRDSFEDLSLELVAGVNSVEAALRVFTKDETLDGADKYRCDACKQLSAATKRISIQTPPNVRALPRILIRCAHAWNYPPVRFWCCTSNVSRLADSARCPRAFPSSSAFRSPALLLRACLRQAIGCMRLWCTLAGLSRVGITTRLYAMRSSAGTQQMTAA